MVGLASLPPLPAGFVLDEPAGLTGGIPPPPPGFVLDTPAMGLVAPTVPEPPSPAAQREAEIADMGALSRGFSGGLRGLGAMSGGAISAIGDALGMENVQDYGREMFENYSAQAAQFMGKSPTLEEVFQSEDKFDDFMTWLGTNVGQGAATSVPALLAFLVNPALGWGVVYGMGVGETYGAQLEESEDPVAAIALGGGAAYALAERTFGVGARVARAIRGGKNKAAKSFLRRLSKEAVKTPASEAVAEFIQQGLQIGGAGLETGTPPGDIFGREQAKEMLEAAAAGAAGGTAFIPLAAAPGPAPEPAAGPPPGAVPPVPPPEGVAPGTGISTAAPPVVDEDEADVSQETVPPPPPGFVMDEIIPAEIRVRASDNLMWVVANNSSADHSAWPTCIARPDGSLTALEQGVPGILYRTFPDKKITDEFPSWTHNNKAMLLPADEVYHNGTPSNHPRATDRRAAP